jgi:hypothetical protein
MINILKTSVGFEWAAHLQLSGQVSDAALQVRQL